MEHRREEEMLLPLNRVSDHGNSLLKPFHQALTSKYSCSVNKHEAHEIIVVTYLAKVCDNDCAIGEFPSSQGTQGFRSGLGCVVLDVDFANTI